MLLDEFVCWDDGTETHYELIGGFPVAMAAPAEAHRMLTVRIVSRIDAALARRRPCNAQIEAGVVRGDRADTYFEADIAATCAANEPGRQAIKDPFLIVEILSPGTERHDRRVKLPAYRQIDSVEEILLVASDEPYAELHRRVGGQWITEIVRGEDGAVGSPRQGWRSPSATSTTGSRSIRPRPAAADRGHRECRRRAG
jgi:Uma2 family endonuclease